MGFFDFGVLVELLHQLLVKRFQWIIAECLLSIHGEVVKSSASVVRQAEAYEVRQRYFVF